LSGQFGDYGLYTDEAKERVFIDKFSELSERMPFPIESIEFDVSTKTRKICYEIDWCEKDNTYNFQDFEKADEYNIGRFGIHPEYPEAFKWVLKVSYFFDLLFQV
jgi:hypothetical protein